MTQAQYAHHRGVSREAVRQAVRDGRIELVDGMVDPQAADESWEANTDPSKVRPRRPPAATTNLAKHKASREQWRALTEELDYKRKLGDLLPRQEVENATFEAHRRARDELHAAEIQLAPFLSPEALRMLREAIKRVCDNLSASPSANGD